MSETTAATEPAIPDEPALPLEQLERALGPVRRTLGWALAAATTRRPLYVEANIGRLLEVAIAQPVPGAVAELLRDARAGLIGVDALGDDVLRNVLVDVRALLVRVDAVLGLPLAKLKLRPTAKRHTKATDEVGDSGDASPRAGDRSSADRSSAHDSDGGRREKRGRGRKRSRKADNAESVPRDARRPSSPKPPVDDQLSGDLDAYLEGDFSADSDTDGDAEIDEDDDDTPGVIKPRTLLVDLAEVVTLAAEREALMAAGLNAVLDLLELIPTGEEHLRPVHGAGRPLPVGERVAVGGRVRLRVSVLHPDGRREDEVLLHGAGPLRVRLNNPIVRAAIDAGLVDGRAIFVGQTLDVDGVVSLTDPEIAVGDGKQGVRLQHYGVPGVDDRVIRALMRLALAALPRVRDPIPADLVARVGLLPRGEALHALHTAGLARPDARDRVVFDELLLAELGLAAERFQDQRERGHAHTLLHGTGARLCAAADITLSDNQALVLEDIKRDLHQATAMQRVVVSDAGVGRGLLTLLTVCMVCEGRAQVMVLAASAAEAEHRFLFTEPLLREAGLTAKLVTGELSRGMRDAVRRGDVHVVFATHELMQQSLEWRKLGLVIAWEDPPWGAAVTWLEGVKPRPDLLIYPSMPVAPEVLLAAYPRCEVSRLDDSGGMRVKARIVSEADREATYQRAADAISRGEQVIVVFPTISGQDALTPAEAMRVVRALGDGALLGRRVALFHGSMPADERQQLWSDFRHRRYDALVATAPIEEAPTAPGVSHVVVEQADRVEVARLPRLVGQLSRGERAGYLVLVIGDHAAEADRERLQALVDAPDGASFGRAELERRGIAALVATSSSNMPAWREVDLARDGNAWLRARMEAHAILAADARLRRPEHAALATQVCAHWARLWPDRADACPIAPPVDEQGSRRRRRRRRRRGSSDA